MIIIFVTILNDIGYDKIGITSLSFVMKVFKDELFISTVFVVTYWTLHLC